MVVRAIPTTLLGELDLDREEDGLEWERRVMALVLARLAAARA